MKIGIITDTHEQVPVIQWAVNLFNNEKIDLFIHLGDIISPIMSGHFRPLEAEKVYIYGNNDGEKNWLEKKFTTIYEPPYIFERNSLVFYCTHVPEAKWETVIEKYDPDFVLFGHTHQMYFEKRDKIVFFNPGESCGLLFGQFQLGLIDTDQKIVMIKDMNGREIKHTY